MEKNVDPMKVSMAEKQMAYGILWDLEHLLDEIKGTTILLSNSLNPENPMQDHFALILEKLSDGLKATNFLTDSLEHVNLFETKN